MQGTGGGGALPPTFKMRGILNAPPGVFWGKMKGGGSHLGNLHLRELPARKAGSEGGGARPSGTGIRRFRLTGC